MPNQFNSPEGDLENYFVSEYWLIDQWVGDTLWTWGEGFNGRLGNNATSNRSTPVTTFEGGTNWKQVSYGYGHAAAVKTDGTLWVWGGRFGGALGTNDLASNRLVPVQTFAGGTNWKQVSCGYKRTAAIKTDGTLWVWGDNTAGVLGTNDTTQRNTPVTTFAGGTNWKQVSLGYGSSMAAIKTDGTLWVWGGNDATLGTNDAIFRYTPVTTFAGGTNWKQVSSGASFLGCSAAIKTDGTLWVWGDNSYGGLGTNDTNKRSTPVTTFAGGTNWKQVDVSPGNMAAIKTDGTLWTWGRNLYGQLGINNTTARCTPVTTFAGGTNWKQVAVGIGGSSTTFSMISIKTDGTLWTWGADFGTGMLGTNDATQRNTPVTTFAGGTNWKQATSGRTSKGAITSGTDPTYFIA
jgi:alpha-tubulin suppressor-like RCC1 family protein